MYISISDAAKAGVYPIQFLTGKKVLTYDFQLNERVMNRENIEGFNNSDVIYLISPDRFADSDPTNNSLEGMPDKFNESDKGIRNGGYIKNRPSNLGYTMGYLICKSYYDNSADKKQAVYKLLNTDDFKKIIKESEYNKIL